MAYALGRRLEYYDQPAVRKIVRDAAAQDYRWSSIILGIVESPAFPDGASPPPSTARIDLELSKETTTWLSSRNRCRGARCCEDSAPRWRCRSWTPCFRRSAAREPPRSPCTGSRRSMCPTGWPWSIGRRRAKAATSSSRPFWSRWRRIRNQMLVLSGIKASWNYIHAGRLRIVSHRHDARRTQRNRDHRRRVDGPAAGADTSPRKRSWRRSNCRWTCRPTRAPAPAI